MEDRLMTVKDLLAFLQVSRRQIYFLLDRGLPFVTIGQHKRFIHQEVIDWLKAHAGRKNEIDHANEGS